MGYHPVFNCPRCKGAGYYYGRKLDGSMDYMRPKPCDYPGCYVDSALNYKMGLVSQQSGVTGKDQKFENFDAEVRGVKKSYRQAWNIAEGIGDFIWLIIYGGVGNGKTHLLNAIANRAIERGFAVKLVMMADLLSELRMAMDKNQTDYRVKELKEVPYLLIDELGLEYGTPWEKEKIDEILGSRWANGRFTVAATNLDIEDLPERLKSRFKDKHLSRWVKNEAGDYRQVRR